MTLAEHLRIQAHANRLANRRLHGAMSVLGSEAFHAPRVGFFPSLSATLNHILEVDQYYVGALFCDAGLQAHWDRFVPDATLAALAERQRISDERLIHFCNALDATGCEQPVVMPRGQGRTQHDRAAHVLAHLFMHQTHHRGQAHAMLSGAGIVPPQLDEFLMPSEAHLRRDDMAALGWSEVEVYGQT